MSNLPMEVLLMIGQTIEKVVPITIVLAVVFSVLTHFWACNHRRRGGTSARLVTDTVYWFFVPVFAVCCGSGCWCSAPPPSSTFTTPIS